MNGYSHWDFVIDHDNILNNRRIGRKLYICDFF